MTDTEAPIKATATGRQGRSAGRLPCECGLHIPDFTEPEYICGCGRAYRSPTASKTGRRVYSNMYPVRIECRMTRDLRAAVLHEARTRNTPMASLIRTALSFYLDNSAIVERYTSNNNGASYATLPPEPKWKATVVILGGPHKGKLYRRRDETGAAPWVLEHSEPGTIRIRADWAMILRMAGPDGVKVVPRGVSCDDA